MATETQQIHELANQEYKYGFYTDVEADALPPAIPPWMQAWGPPPSEYGSRSVYESGVVRLPSATSSRSPLRDFFGSFTPNSLFYERHHAGVPTIDPSLHRLMVHGLVDRPTIFTMDDIKRFPAVSVINFMECSGNSGSEWTEERIAEIGEALAPVLREALETP